MNKAKVMQILNVVTLALAFLIALGPAVFDFLRPWPTACSVSATALATIARFAALVEVGKSIARAMGILPKPEESAK